MTRGLKRYQASGQTHYVTFSCYRRQPLLTNPSACRVYLEVLEVTRVRFKLRIYAYVVMPEHVHLLLSEPDVATLANAIHFLKLSSSKRIHRLSGAEGAFWQKRYYDFIVHGERKRIEKLRYIHRNPVRRGLCAKPEEWPWSSFRHYATGEEGVIEIESEWTARKREALRKSRNPG